MAVAFALLTTPFVGLLVWAGHHPYSDLERTYAVGIGVLGVFLFGLPALWLTVWRPAHSDDVAEPSAPQPTNIPPREPAFDEEELDRKWAALLDGQRSGTIST